MKKVIFLIFFVCFASIVFAKGNKKASSCLLIFESETGWVYEDSLVNITYDIDYGGWKANFWGSYAIPHVYIKIKNKTANMIYVDLGSSFLIRDDDSEPYYIPGQTVSSSGSSHGGSVNLGSVAGALGVGGVVGGLASGVNVGGGSSTSTSNITFNQRILAIPPMAAKELEPKPLSRYHHSERFAGDSDLVTDHFGEVIVYSNYGSKKKPIPYLRARKGIFGKMEEGEIKKFPNEDHYIQVNMYISYSQNENLSNIKTAMHKCECKSVMGCRLSSYGDMKTEEPEYLKEKKYKTILVKWGW